MNRPKKELAKRLDLPANLVAMTACPELGLVVGQCADDLTEELRQLILHQKEVPICSFDKP